MVPVLGLFAPEGLGSPIHCLKARNDMRLRCVCCGKLEDEIADHEEKEAMDALCAKLMDVIRKEEYSTESLLNALATLAGVEIALVVRKRVGVTRYRTEGAVIDYLVRTLSTWTEAMAYDAIERLQEARPITHLNSGDNTVN
jgi:hypothetical protein